ncbi:LysR family transcriptional regulator [Pinisolibacter aquiterrae]|uniref:LysR family transcriptional regulator n=1 Tax=Pinisolibacter aquiterrae TaxID=2815579 RepID=UPI001C3C4D2C|nr:LysR family transcriptional regulator [Pinisolibacter aquiterrae]MBV5265705.1 LysR family transcriptional regulator [Pinisolibacter aquiterrae]MCC8236730.1 LysR family transcriptional regulator [Pinisolibacter aquiterrae]
MTPRDPGAFDLNLIKVFLAIWETRGISGAGERLGLTQPAVSHALRRLREQFADPLFLRVGHTMEPTPAARRLHEPFAQAYGLLGRTMAAHAEFRPETSTRTFTIAMSDVSEFYCLPQILARLAEVAPNLRIRSVQLDAESIAAALRSGRIDMALGHLPDLPADEIVSTFLLRDRFVCLLAAGHEQAGRALDVEAFSRLDFVEVAVHATGYKTIDERLTALGAARTTVVSIEHYTIVPEIVRHSKLAAIFPRSVSRRLAARGDFALLDLPFDLPAIDVDLHVHVNFTDDPGLRWFRTILPELFAEDPPPSD